MVGGRWDAPGLVGSGFADLESWRSEPGQPGWTSEAWLGVPYLPVFAGHVTGSWSQSTADAAPESMPWPGVPARHSLAWADSVGAWFGPGSAWSGFDGALASVSALRFAPADARARAVFRYATGDLGADQNALAFERGDSLGWGRIEAATARRGAAGSLGLTGAHLWSVSGSSTRGRHRVDGAFTQRGYGGELFERTYREASSGQSATLGWRYTRGVQFVSTRLERAFDQHQSYDDGSESYLLYSRRDARETRATAEWGRARGARKLGARIQFADIEVRRATPTDVPFYLNQTFDRRERTWWGSVACTTPALDGVLRMELGAGRSRALGSTLVAPGASLAFGDSRLGGRLVAMRVVQPVWSDLFAGQAPFLQNTWAGGFELSSQGALRAQGSLLVGVTRDRAIWLRHPIQDLALRYGALPSTGRDGFTLATSGFDWRGRHFGAGASGFVLRSERSASQAQVDPGFGARAGVETRFTLFQGDLGITLRAETAAVGPRENEATSARLPGYLTSGATVSTTLGDAVIVFRVRNLENTPHEETWLDPRDLSVAKGPRRELTFSLTWRLFN